MPSFTALLKSTELKIEENLHTALKYEDVNQGPHSRVSWKQANQLMDHATYLCYYQTDLRNYYTNRQKD